MSAKEIARRLERHEDAVKGALATMARKGEIEEKGSQRSRMYRACQGTTQMQLMTMVWVSPEWLTRLEDMGYG